MTTAIEQSHVSHNALVPYSTIRQFLTEILLQNDALLGYLMRCGICEMGKFAYGIN